jgi:hypothetical protein
VAGVTDSIRQQHGDITSAAADVEHAHPRSDTALPNEPSGHGLNNARLELKAVNFTVMVTQSVDRSEVHVTHV